jgi:hypothetical protein
MPAHGVWHEEKKNAEARIALTSYLGNQGLDYFRKGGVLFSDSRIRYAEITDGLSQTFLFGERPPSSDDRFGWWYGGTDMDRAGALDTVLGVRERNPTTEFARVCGLGPFPFRAIPLDDKCAPLQFWSLHSNGTYFALCDGSARFVTYRAEAILPLLAQRADGEAIPE